jgi:hypothetical protein
MAKNLTFMATPPFETVAEALEAALQSAEALENMPADLQTAVYCLAAVQNDDLALRSVPKKRRTSEIFKAAAQSGEVLVP